MDLGHRLAAVLAKAVLGNQVHRPRPEERVGGDEVLDAVGLHLQQELAHAAGFELQDPGGVSPPEKLEDLLVVVGEPVEVEGVGAIFSPAPPPLRERAGVRVR